MYQTAPTTNSTNKTAIAIRMFRRIPSDIGLDLLRRSGIDVITSDGLAGFGDTTMTVLQPEQRTFFDSVIGSPSFMVVRQAEQVKRIMITRAFRWFRCTKVTYTMA